MLVSTRSGSDSYSMITAVAAGGDGAGEHECRLDSSPRWWSGAVLSAVTLAVAFAESVTAVAVKLFHRSASRFP